MHSWTRVCRHDSRITFASPVHDESLNRQTFLRFRKLVRFVSCGIWPFCFSIS